MSLSVLLSTQISHVKRLKNQNTFAFICDMNLSAEASNSGNDNYTQIAIYKMFLVSLLQLFILLHLLNFTFGVGDPPSSCLFILAMLLLGVLKIQRKNYENETWRNRISDR